MRQCYPEKELMDEYSLKRVIITLQRILREVIAPLHLSWFYWCASSPFPKSLYYDIPRRILEMPYVSHPQRPPVKSRPNMPLAILASLSALSAAIQCCRILHQEYVLYRETQDKEDVDETNEKAFKCPLCVSPYDDDCIPTALLCGHVFCWKCICAWLEERKVLCHREIH